MTEENSDKGNAGDKAKEILLSRKGIAVRLLYTLIFLVVLGVVSNIVWIIAAFQYLFLFITRSYIKPLRRFSANLTLYIKEVIDYILITRNKRPFPFTEFPKTVEEPEALDIEDIKE